MPVRLEAGGVGERLKPAVLKPEIAQQFSEAQLATLREFREFAADVRSLLARSEHQLELKLMADGLREGGRQ